jgi:hypothetical protein
MLLAPWLQILLITLKYRAISDLHTFRFTVAHALEFLVLTSRLLATDLNTETSTSNHCEVFLLFRLQSLWYLGTKNSSGLTTPAYDWLVTILELTLLLHSLPSALHRPHGKHRLYCCWRHCLRRSVFTEPLLTNGLHNTVVLTPLGADDIENIAPSIAACWAVFIELLPGNALIKSVTISRPCRV